MKKINTYSLVCVTLRCTVKIELVFNYFETMPLSHPPNEVLNFMGTSVSKSTAAPESACNVAHICWAFGPPLNHHHQIISFYKTADLIVFAVLSTRTRNGLEGPMLLNIWQVCRLPEGLEAVSPHWRWAFHQEMIWRKQTPLAYLHHQKTVRSEVGCLKNDLNWAKGLCTQVPQCGILFYVHTLTERHEPGFAWDFLSVNTK